MFATRLIAEASLLGWWGGCLQTLIKCRVTFTKEWMEY